MDRGSTHNLAKTLRDISSAGVDTRLLFDWEGDSFQFCEVTTSISPLEIESNSLFTTDSTLPPIMVVDDYKYYLTSDRTFLPEVGEYNLNIFPEVFDGTGYQLEDGSLFEWQEIREI